MVRRGFSLIEVIIALTLLGVGMLSVAASGVTAARLQRDTELREEILLRAMSVLDSLIAHRIQGAGEHRTDRYCLRWSAGQAVVELKAELDDTLLFELEAVR